jgi:Bacterial tandem repeat domain 1
MALVWQARHGIRGRNEFQAVFDSLSNQGLRMIDVSGFGLGGVDHHACTWEQSGGPPWAARHFLDRNEHQLHFNELTGQGFRPIRVSGYDAGGVARYA